MKDLNKDDKNLHKNSLNSKHTNKCENCGKDLNKISKSDECPILCLSCYLTVLENKRRTQIGY